MAVNQHVNIDNLSVAIGRIMQDYQDAIMSDVEDSAKETAKETAQEIRSNAKSMFKGKGKYAGSWKYKRNTEDKRKSAFSMVVYADKNGYRLAHLLENGHAKVIFGKITNERVSGRKHIAPAADHAEKSFISKLKTSIESRR